MVGYVEKLKSSLVLKAKVKGKIVRQFNAPHLSLNTPHPLVGITTFYLEDFRVNFIWNQEF